MMLLIRKRLVALILMFFVTSPLLAQVALDNYRLGAGDKIRIQVYGEDDLTVETLVGDIGTVSYPFLGELKVKGLTIAQLEENVTRGLKGPYLVDPEVTVSILQYRQFYVNGRVEKPGGFAFQPGMTVRKAISLAGGFQERANKEKIFVVRGDDATTRSTKIGLDAYIRPGDIITVERSFF